MDSGDPKKIEALFDSIGGILEYLVPFAILAAIIFVIIGGYMWISSTGNPDKVKQAQGTLTWAIIGLIFVLLVSLLLQTLVDYVTGM
jgi:TRAP-type C4-dicarboxylate transport system permease small subunit